MRKYKVGDVLWYAYSGGHCEGVVRVPFEDAGHNSILVWYRYVEGHHLHIKSLRVGAFNPEMVSEHPNPDQLWTDYCAALLTGELDGAN